MITIINDIKYGVRQLIKSPGFSVVAVLTLTLGIGANTAFFGVLNNTLLRPLPYPKSKQLVHIEERIIKSNRNMSVSYPNFIDWKRLQTSFSALTIYRSDAMLNLTTETVTERVETTYNLTFVDNVFGNPPLYNTLVEEGMSITPNKIDGTVTFVCAPTKPPVEGIAFWLGGDVGPDGDPSMLGCADGYAGGEAKVVFYYTSVDKPIQGISMAVKFDPALDVADIVLDDEDDTNGEGIVAARHLEDTLTLALNAEFVSFNADNNGELIIGVLVDSTPPVPINHMYPPRDTLGKVINIFFSVPADAPCNVEDPQTYSIWFAPEGVYAGGEVLISNRVAILNESYPATGNPEESDSAMGCIAVAPTTKTSVSMRFSRNFELILYSRQS